MDENELKKGNHESNGGREQLVDNAKEISFGW